MKLLFKLRQITRQMWFLPAVLSFLAFGTVVASRYSGALLPKKLPFNISDNAIESILTIVATSMLTVATFALATMVNAFFGAAQATTPRAVRLIAEDRAAQAPISIFIGAFLFSVVGIIALSSGFYSASGRLVLFGVTILVIILVVGALIRWINKISSIGQVSETLERIEITALAAFREIAEKPLLGCSHATPATENGVPVHAATTGYVQHLQPDVLQEVAEECGLFIHVVARPGAYATAVRPLALVTGVVDEAVEQKIREAFVLGRDRTFDHDPRFALIVLNEIAARALSPGINDPGTAISVIHTEIRIFDDWFSHEAEAGSGPEHYRVSMVPISERDILDDAFRPIARDGAGNVEVCVKLFEALRTIRVLSPERFGGPVDRFAADLLDRAREALSHKADVDVVEQVALRAGTRIR